MADYLVTGGAGFVGSHLADALLARGDGVVVLDNMATGKRSNLASGVRLVEADVCDPDAVLRAMTGCAGVFHLAGIASVEYCNRHWREGHLTNQTGSVTVFEAAAQSGRIPVVYTSSAAVYGDASDAAVSEDRQPRPQTAYGSDKLGSELHGRIAHSVHGLPTVGFRPFNIYGPRQDPSSAYSGVISIFNEKLRRRQPVTVFGDGQQTRDFVFVADVVAFLLAGMAQSDRAAGQVFNICTGRSTTLLDLIGTLAKLHEVAADISYDAARQGDIRQSLGDPARAREVLGVTADVHLKDGLRMLLQS